MKKHFIILATFSVGLVLMLGQSNVHAQEEEVEEKKVEEDNEDVSPIEQQKAVNIEDIDELEEFEPDIDA